MLILFYAYSGTYNLDRYPHRLAQEAILSKALREVHFETDF